MIEAVGHEHLEAYFRTLGAVVKPGGKVVVQVGWAVLLLFAPPSSRMARPTPAPWGLLGKELCMNCLSEVGILIS